MSVSRNGCCTCSCSTDATFAAAGLCLRRRLRRQLSRIRPPRAQPGCWSRCAARCLECFGDPTPPRRGLCFACSRPSRRRSLHDAAPRSSRRRAAAWLYTPAASSTATTCWAHHDREHRAEVENSDGEHWVDARLRHKAGEQSGARDSVAPHQPAARIPLWFYPGCRISTARALCRQPARSACATDPRRWKSVREAAAAQARVGAPAVLSLSVHHPVGESAASAVWWRRTQRRRVAPAPL